MKLENGAAEPLVVVRHISKNFGALRVLNDVSMTVKPREVVAILGPSGSGKSTLLRCINNLEEIDEGLIEVEGTPIGYGWVGDRLRKLGDKAAAFQRRRIGMVFQQFNLFPHMTVIQNIVEAPIGVNRVPEREAHEYARELLTMVGLSDKAQAYPKELSGGQQQRVAIARALAMKPALMLFDEPTSALDPELVDEVTEVMQKLAEDGMTMVIVTHELEFARNAADRIVFMDRGVILEEGDTQTMLNNPSHPRVRAFFSSVNGDA